MSIGSSDGQLVIQLRDGNLEALGALYERHKTTVYRTALAITRDPSVAEDILQDCFLRLHRYAYSIDSSLPLRPWLYRVTTNLAYNWEKRKKYWSVSLDEVLDWLASSSSNSPERRAEMSDMQSQVMDAVHSLSTNQRIVIVLHYLNSLDLKEIASILDCPIGTVKSRLHYGRENLRRKLDTRHSTTPEMAYELASSATMS
ncbi:MAG: RNA polymerase sigma factor [Chloroflexi bacterium]|nr:RNA polymerase sigma factor [Chloroflexota bacterium]